MAGNRTLKLSILADVDDLKKKLDTGSKEVEGFGGKLGEFGKKAAAAFAVAAAAAAAYAGKLLIDGVKAAIEDEKAQVKLAQTLENTTGATRAQIKAVENQILKMSLATGVADDELRPSFERLVRATNDVEKAQKLQALALDVAAGSGKSLDSVSQALAKAYDGNTASLTRLGVGLSSAEIKSMSLDDITNKLAETFGGQAALQADTFSGKMARMQVAFDEAKESVGARLLPILTQLLDAFNTKIGPAVQAIQDKFRPLTKAIDDNKEEFRALWDFLNKYIVPILSGALKLAFSGIVSTITGVVNIVGKAVNFFNNLYDAYKKFIDFIKNNPLSQFLGKLNPFNNSSFSQANFVTGGAGTSQAFMSQNASTNFTDPFQNFFGSNMPDKRRFMALFQHLQSGEFLSPLLEWKLEEALLGRRFDGTGERPGITINVNSPSIIDQEGFTRSVIDALNNSQSRTGSLGTLTI